MRSKLFVPGSRPDLFDKAMSSAAGAVSIDLEDAVLEGSKPAARTAVADFLARVDVQGKTLIVRVNALGSEHFELDLKSVVHPSLDLMNLPKVESAEEVRAAAFSIERLERERSIQRPIGLLLNIESPKGLRMAFEIASAHPRVAGLQLGFADLFEPLGVDRRDEQSVRQIQLAVRIAAGEAGVFACDAAFPDVKDADGFQREARTARLLGYVGKSCIHPKQIALANDVFRPSEEEICAAQHVMAAARKARSEGLGVCLVDGKMIDKPFERRAEAVVALARHLGLLCNEQAARRTID